MEWLRISTSTELVRVATDEIVYVRADGNYSDLVLTNGKSRKMTFQLHFFDEVFQQLQNNMFARVGRSLIVNKPFPPVSSCMAKWSVEPSVASVTNSISLPPATRKLFGTLPMPSVNMASSMPSTSLAVLIMCSIAVKTA